MLINSLLDNQLNRVRQVAWVKGTPSWVKGTPLWVQGLALLVVSLLECPS